MPSQEKRVPHSIQEMTNGLRFGSSGAEVLLTVLSVCQPYDTDSSSSSVSISHMSHCMNRAFVVRFGIELSFTQQFYTSLEHAQSLEQARNQLVGVFSDQT